MGIVHCVCTECLDSMSNKYLEAEMNLEDEQVRRLLATAVKAIRMASQYPNSISNDSKELEHYVTFN